MTVQDMLKSVEPRLGRALGAVAGTALDQARDLVVAQLDCWSERVRAGVAAVDAEAEASPDDTTMPQGRAGLVTPMLIGAVAGATLAWLMAKRVPRN